MKTVGVIQARMGSRRLPGKVLLPLAGKPALEWILERVRASRLLDEVVVATTLLPGDDAIADLCAGLGVPVIRGSEEDVLARFHQAAVDRCADTVVRLTADDPLKDPQVIDAALKLFARRRPDLCTTSYPPTFPEGLDVEVMTARALRLAHEKARDPFEREHVTQYFYRRPEQHAIVVLRHDPDLSALRFTMDTTEDYSFLSAVYEALARPGEFFSLDDVLALLKRRPELVLMNRGAPRSAMYRGEDGS